MQIPNMTSLATLDVGARSTLLISREGELYRRYHDTNFVDGPLLPHVDSEGVVRYGGNRRVESLLSQAVFPSDDVQFRGVGGDSNDAKQRKIPKHLQNALKCMSRMPSDIQSLARMCGVEVSTAWNYASRVVDHWPMAHTVARQMVYPPLLEALETQVSSTEGSLRDLINRVDATDLLRGDVEWRCVDNRIAHLRLARLCVEAAVR